MSLSTTSEVWVLRTQLNIYDGGFLAIPWTKAKIFNWVLNTPLKLWTDFTVTTWLWFGWVICGFSTSLMSTFIQIFQKLILKKNSNNLMLKTNRAYSRNLGQRPILARRAFFMKIIQNKALHYFRKRGQYSIVEHKIGLEYALSKWDSKEYNKFIWRLFKLQTQTKYLE